MAASEGRAAGAAEPERASAVFARLLSDSVLWAPVFLGAGIGLYFSLKAEPDLPLAVWAGGLGVLWLAKRRSGHPATRALWGALLLVALGLGLGTLRTARVAAPVLTEPFAGAVEGRYIKTDLSASGRSRVLLDNVVLHGLHPDETPRRVRVVVAKPERLANFRPGDRLLIYARLSAPGPPVEVGGFDFRRYSWFRQWGAVGFATGPVMPALAQPPPDAYAHLQRLRHRLSANIRAQIPGESGAFAAAILIGDRSSLNAERLDDLRASNLAHLLAISGLHMGLVTGIVFGFVRLGLALNPPFADRHPIKSYAAFAAILAGAIYLVFSGSSIATQRAFIMAAIAFGAVLIGRPALTLRAVALAALAILAYRPESLTEPGFQMSFAATTALVFVFGKLSARPWWSAPREGWRRVLRWGAALVVSSGTAGIATAPFGAFHFNQVAQYGLLANVLAVPIMGTVVMPFLLLGLLLSPVLLSAPAMAVAGFGISAILGIATWVAGLDGALRLVPKGPDVVLGLVAFGAIVTILLQHRLRMMGPVVVLVGLLVWTTAQRPLVLVDPKGTLVGAMSDGKRALSKGRGAGLAATVWLENDGDPALQKTAAERLLAGEGWPADMPLAVMLEPNGVGAGLVRYAAQTSCGTGDVMVALKEEVRLTTASQCRVIDKKFVEQNGAIALYLVRGGLKLVTSKEHDGRRPWTMPAAFVQ